MDATKMGALEGIVSEVDGEGPEAQAQAQAEAQAQAQAVSEAQAWSQVPFAIGKLVCMVAPELEPVYSQEACEQWGTAMVPVAAKYGWGGPNLLPEVGLLIATATFAIPSYMVVKARLAALKAAQQQRPPADAGVIDGC